MIVFPSTWEGFGNPPIEASIRRRPVAVGAYPVLDEMLDLGFRWLDASDPAEVRELLAAPDEDVLARNHQIARDHFSTEQMTERLAAVLRRAGWLDDRGWSP